MTAQCKNAINERDHAKIVAVISIGTEFAIKVVLPKETKGFQGG
jgi:hypothetical protein